VQAGVLSYHDNNHIEAVLVDVIPITLGVETVEEFMNKLVSRNTPIPTSKSRIFSTFANNQTSVAIKVYVTVCLSVFDSDCFCLFVC